MNDGFANHGILNENYHSSAAVTRERIRARANAGPAGPETPAGGANGNAEPDGNTPPDEAPSGTDAEAATPPA